MSDMKSGKAGHTPALPKAVYHYLAHTVSGRSIRALARESGLHPSTVLRQVRRYEGRRDDPLVDAALRAYGPNAESETRPSMGQTPGDTGNMMTDLKLHASVGSDGLTEARMNREALNILRRLCEARAVLAVAREMESAVVVREDASGASVRTAVVEREIAQAMALRGWISSEDTEARIARYRITAAGREALRKLTAAEENKALGFKEAAQGFDTEGWGIGAKTRGSGRYMVTESPLIGLARRRDRNGEPFLSKEQVGAGERLRQDFELSSPGSDVREDWREALREDPEALPKATNAARARIVAALDDLGPGLQDVAIRCCCFLEGMEVTERNMGWSARSGKIVLRIALSRLIRHYEETQGKYGPLIG